LIKTILNEKGLMKKQIVINWGASMSEIDFLPIPVPFFRDERPIMNGKSVSFLLLTDIPCSWLSLMNRIQWDFLKILSH